jgi:hypothetical protein
VKTSDVTGTRIGYWEGKLERKRTLGRRKRRWVDNIEIDLVDIEHGGVVWTGLVWLRKGKSLELL